MRTLFVADDATRDRLKAPLAAASQVVGEVAVAATGLASTKAQVVASARDLACELLVVGAGAVPMDAVILAAAVTAELPTLNVLLVAAEPVDQLVVMAAMRAGIREIVAPATDAALTRALERARQFHRRVAGARTAELAVPATAAPWGKLVVVHAPKGGCGKSTLAANLAAALAKGREAPAGEGARAAVALVDLVSQFGELDLLFNLEATRSLGDLVRMPEAPDAETVLQATLGHPSGVRVLAAPRDPEDGELLTGQRAAAVLEALQERCAWVVVDTEGTLTEATLEAIQRADRVLVPFVPDVGQLRRLQGGLALWARLGIDLGKVELVAWTAPGDVSVEDAERVLKRPVPHRVPADASAVRAAIDAGEPLVLGAPGTAAAQGLVQLAACLADGPEAARALVPVGSRTQAIALMWRWFTSMVGRKQAKAPKALNVTIAPDSPAPAVRR